MGAVVIIWSIIRRLVWHNQSRIPYLLLSRKNIIMVPELKKCSKIHLFICALVTSIVSVIELPFWFQRKIFTTYYDWLCIEILKKTPARFYNEDVYVIDWNFLAGLKYQRWFLSKDNLTNNRLAFLALGSDS